MYYEEMLLSMYKYQIALDGMNRKYGENNKLPNNDKLENACREKLIKYLSGTFELSCRLWNEGILEKVKKNNKTLVIILPLKIFISISLMKSFI